MLTASLQYNTYGDPPNSDLLRRYGHVDIVPLLQHGRVGNPADVVEVGADVVLSVIEASEASDKISQSPHIRERVEWWLEEGGDECVFALFACRC